MQSLISLLIIAVIASCSGNPFMTNIFGGIDNYSLPDSFDNVDDILDEAGDDGFLDALADNPELADDVIDILEASLPEDAADADSDDQEAALLLADVHLATTEADETINNVNDLLTGFIAGDEGEDSPDMDDPASIIPDLFVLDETLTPAEQQTAVEEQLAAFLAAADALEFYGDTIVAGQDPSSEVNPGETAATAMISGMTAFIIQNMDTSSIDPDIVAANPGATDDELAIAALADVIVNGSDMPDIGDPTYENGDPLPDDATTEEYINVILGDGLAEVVGQGFDLSSFENM